MPSEPPRISCVRHSQASIWCQFFPSQPTLNLLPPIYNLIENPDEHPANKA